MTHRDTRKTKAAPARYGEKTKSQYHSRVYHRYFEGWAEKVVIAGAGTPVIKRVYIGSYYSANLTGRQRLLRKLLYVALYLVAAALYGFTGTRNTAVALVKYASVPVGLAFPVMLCLLVPLYFNLTVPAEMIVRQYRDSSATLRGVCAAAFALLGLSALTALLFLALTPDAPAGQTLLCAGGYLLSASAVFAIWRLEKKLVYTVLPPRAERPEYSTVI
jgi:hypothetical protein